MVTQVQGNNGVELEKVEGKGEHITDDNVNRGRKNNQMNDIEECRNTRLRTSVVRCFCILYSIIYVLDEL